MNFRTKVYFFSRIRNKTDVKTLIKSRVRENGDNTND